jgi:hypothetical protein
MEVQKKEWSLAPIWFKMDCGPLAGISARSRVHQAIDLYPAKIFYSWRYPGLDLDGLALNALLFFWIKKGDRKPLT